MPIFQIYMRLPWGNDALKFASCCRRCNKYVSRPHRLEMVKHLTTLVFYMAHPFFQKRIDTTKQTRQNFCTFVPFTVRTIKNQDK
jgi:hypothetical protein